MDYKICKDINAATIKKANDDIASNTNFKLLKENTSWLDKRTNEPKSLELGKYKEYQKNVATTVSQNASLIKQQTALNLSVLKEDNNKFYNNTDKQKGERYQAWLKAISNDIYVAQSIEITKGMMNNIVANNQSISY